MPKFYHENQPSNPLRRSAPVPGRTTEIILKHVLFRFGLERRGQRLQRFLDLSGWSPVYARNEKIAGTARYSYVSDGRI